MWYHTQRQDMSYSSEESWAQYRRRMLRETERFIEYGLRHPDEIIEIPSKPVGTGGFPAAVSQWFWGVVLTTRTDSRLERIRQRLRRGAKGLLGMR